MNSGIPDFDYRWSYGFSAGFECENYGTGATTICRDFGIAVG
ncbi:MAG: hypothetical protein PHV82_03410 [Victivallaceae bacterium]|nr:hypothetical protein [Victivallaceae bacterium]